MKAITITSTGSQHFSPVGEYSLPPEVEERVQIQMRGLPDVVRAYYIGFVPATQTCRGYQFAVELTGGSPIDVSPLHQQMISQLNDSIKETIRPAAAFGLVVVNNLHLLWGANGVRLFLEHAKTLFDKQGQKELGF